MRVLLIGKGGREHALAWKLARSPLLTRLYVWPASPVFTGLAEAVDLSADASLPAVVEQGRQLGVDLVVVGPEGPLSQGAADLFEAAGIPTFGPRQAAARLEADKSFAKDVMGRAGIPTAAYRLAGSEDECRRLALETLASKGGVVLKASGLAAGKGVFVCTSPEDVEDGLRRLYHTDMTAAAATVVVEEVLRGRECSYFTFIGPGGPTGLGFAVDFKRLEDQDQGPNTGGMGCYAPVAWLPEGAAALVEERVVAPLLETLRREGLDYRGCLYVGLMWSPERGPQVVEFNVRLGDPEAQVLAALDDRDWLALMADKCGLPVPPAVLAPACRPLSSQGARAVAVVMASQSYPFGRETGPGAAMPLALFANDPARPVRVFAASVHPAEGGGVRTGQGRVLTVAARASSYAAARQLAYTKVDEIAAGWPGARYRRDIAQRIQREVEP